VFSLSYKGWWSATALNGGAARIALTAVSNWSRLGLVARKRPRDLEECWIYFVHYRRATCLAR
jgi:hypothetical protein